MDALRDTARGLVARGKGILAADESSGTIEKRFDQIGVTSTEETRRAYRQLLFTTPGLEEHISGVIFFDETIRQATDDGTRFTEVLEKAGVIPGIKVDTGAKPLALLDGETVTEGLDGLRERLAEYHELGARFAKWRATYFIGDGRPTDFAVLANGHAMARYAALCQEAGDRPDRRARDLDGRRPRPGGVRGRHGASAPGPLRAAARSPGRPRRLPPEGEHGRSRQGGGRAGGRPRDRGGHPADAYGRTCRRRFPGSCSSPAG